jgi:proprotein convertase subtilisin/kexin type 5
VSTDGATCCSSNCTACTSKSSKESSVCNTCASGFTLVEGRCRCYGTVANGVCTPCAEGTYFDSDTKSCPTCESKTPHCSTCALKGGDCQTCTSPYELNSEYETCVCPAGTFDTGTDCITLTECPVGEYNDIVNNTCVACGANCDACENGTGACTTCNETYPILDISTTPESCVDTCSTYVGEVGSTSVCMSTPYSADRLLPPFPQDATSVDWRDKYVVQSVQN